MGVLFVGVDEVVDVLLGEEFGADAGDDFVEDDDVVVWGGGGV